MDAPIPPIAVVPDRAFFVTSQACDCRQPAGASDDEARKEAHLDYVLQARSDRAEAP